MKDRIHYNKLCDILDTCDIKTYSEKVVKPAAKNLANYICHHSEDKLADLIELEMLGGRVPKKNKIRIDVTLDVDVTAREVEWDWVHDTYGEVKHV